MHSSGTTYDRLNVHILASDVFVHFFCVYMICFVNMPENFLRAATRKKLFRHRKTGETCLIGTFVPIFIFNFEFVKFCGDIRQSYKHRNDMRNSQFTSNEISHRNYLYNKTSVLPNRKRPNLPKAKKLTQIGQNRSSSASTRFETHPT